MLQHAFTSLSVLNATNCSPLSAIDEGQQAKAIQEAEAKAVAEVRAKALDLVRKSLKS
jgi:hypothetical protein